MEVSKQEWYNGDGWLLFWLIFFFPVGIYGIYMRNKHQIVSNSETTSEEPKQTIPTSYKLVFSSIMFILSFHNMSCVITSILLSIIYMLIGLFICPLTYKMIFVDYLKKSYKTKNKWLILISLLLSAFIFIHLDNKHKEDVKKDEDNKEDNKIAQKINTFIDNNKIQDAISIIDDYKKDNNIEILDTSNVICKIQIEILDSQDYNYMCKKMSSLNDDDIKLLKQNKLNKNYFKQKTLNKNFIEFLFKNFKNHKSIKDEIIKQYEKEVREQLIEEIKINIKTHFKGFSGEHGNLSEHIKTNLNNPDSYDHVSTSYDYIDGDDYYTIYTTIRATNGFNAIITNSYKARADLAGNIISIKEY